MARSDWQTISGTTNNNNAFFTGIRWRYRDDLFGTTGYPTDRISSNTDIIEYQPFVGKKSSGYTSNYYNSWLTSNYKYSYNTVSGEEPPAAANTENVSTTYRFDKASVNTNYYLTKGGLTSGNVMNTSSNTTSKIIQVPHCSDGTSKLRLYFYFAGYSGTSFTSATTNGIVTLETIPRANKITVIGVNIGEGTSIIINKTSPSFTTTLSYRAKKEDNTWTSWDNGLIVTKTSTDGAYGWTVPTSLYSLCPNNRTILCEFKGETYNGNTKIGETTTTATFTANIYPTINDITAVTTDTLTTDLTNDNTNKTVIKGVSTLSITVSATAGTGASMASYTIDGVNQTSNTRSITNASSDTYSVSAYDTRGEPPTTQNVQMTFVDYVPLSINATISRNTPTDGKVNISFSGNYFNNAFGEDGEDNTLTIEYRYKESTSNTWEDWVDISNEASISGNTYTATDIEVSNITYTNIYNFEIRATDEVGTKTITGITIPKGEPVYWWDDDGIYVNGSLKINDLNVYASDIYSSNETAVGKWLDNKTIYRKCYTGTTTTITTPGYFVITDNDLRNVSTLIKFDYFIKDGTVFVPIPNVGDRLVSTYVQTSYGGVGFIVHDSNFYSDFSNRDYVIILEYTKSS